MAVRSSIWGGFLISDRRGLQALCRGVAAAPPPTAALLRPLIAFVAGACFRVGSPRCGGIRTPSSRARAADDATPYYSLGELGGANLMPEWAGRPSARCWAPSSRSSATCAHGLLVHRHGRRDGNFITLYTGWWSTFAYLAAMGAGHLRHLDDWMGLGDQRARLLAILPVA
ncbi:MAG: hypothetical protein U0869_04040 [Chloroflexota bacterium]